MLPPPFRESALSRGASNVRRDIRRSRNDAPRRALVAHFSLRNDFNDTFDDSEKKKKSRAGDNCARSSQKARPAEPRRNQNPLIKPATRAPLRARRGIVHRSIKYIIIA